jgi:phospholipase/carboxylesterase
MTEIDGPRAAPASGGAAKQLVILAHGYGADGQDLIGLAPHLAKLLPDAAFVAPNAPEPCAMSGFGYQWWGIGSFSAEERWAGVNKAAPVLDDFISQELERAGLNEAQLALVGFSQGTMMALHVGLRRRAQVAGIVGFSGALVGPEYLAGEIRSRPPVLMLHGDADEMVPLQSMYDAVHAMQAADITVEQHVSAGVGHGISPEGLALACKFLSRIF